MSHSHGLDPKKLRDRERRPASDRTHTSASLGPTPHMTHAASCAFRRALGVTGDESPCRQHLLLAPPRRFPCRSSRSHALIAASLERGVERAEDSRPRCELRAAGGRSSGSVVRLQRHLGVQAPANLAAPLSRRGRIGSCRGAHLVACELDSDRACQRGVSAVSGGPPGCAPGMDAGRAGRAVSSARLRHCATLDPSCEPRCCAAAIAA